MDVAEVTARGEVDGRMGRRGLRMDIEREDEGVI